MTDQQPPGYPPPGNQPQGYLPPAYPPQGYPPPGFGYPPPYGPVRGTNTLAVVALVSIFVFTPVALVLGIIARNQIRETGEEGAGMALAAIICGAVSLALVALLFMGFFVVAIGVAGSGGVDVAPR